MLGGSFNPPHLGHLAVARHALAELALDRVLLMPAHTAPHKSAVEDPGPEHRLSMCTLSVHGATGLGACGLEIERGGASYTVDTLRSIHAIHPQAQLTFIVGADIASTLASWREPEELLSLAGLAVAARAGSDRQPLLDTLASLGGEDASFLEMPVVDVSSSMVRDRAGRGQPIAELVGAPVAEYIAEHRLYRSLVHARDATGAGR